MFVQSFKLVVLALSTLILQVIYANDIGPHDKFLRENFDLTEAKMFREDADWWVSCFFVDVNNDGFLDVISTSLSQADRDGNSYSFWTTKPDGKLHLIGRDKLNAENFGFWAFNFSYYRIDLEDGRKNVIGLDIDAGYFDANKEELLTSAPDCVFGITSDNQLSIKEISPNLDELFISSGVCRIERLFAEGFRGFSFVPAKKDEWFGYKFPELTEPAKAPIGFDDFLSAYQKEILTRSAEVNEVLVYAVFLDANQDGLTDCYVTSSADNKGGGLYRWQLYMNSGKGFEKAKGAVCPATKRSDVPMLAPEVFAKKDAFCRIIRFDVPQTYIVLDMSMIKKGYVKKTITNRATHSIEKLPCWEYLREARGTHKIDISSVSNALSAIAFLDQFSYADTNLSGEALWKYSLYRHEDALKSLVQKDFIPNETNVLMRVADVIARGRPFSVANREVDLRNALRHDRFVEFGDSNYLIRAGLVRFGPTYWRCHQEYSNRERYNSRLEDFRINVFSWIQNEISRERWNIYPENVRNALLQEFYRRANMTEEEERRVSR